MQLAQQQDGQQVRPRWTQKNRGPDFPPFQSLILFHQRHRVVMNGVGDLVTQRSGKLVGVLYEIEKRIDDIHVAARSCECVRLSFVNQVKLEWMVVSWLRRPGYGIGNRLQLVIQG